VRKIIERSDAENAKYVQADCVDVHPERDSITCIDPSSNSKFELKYDHLIVAVGCQPSTFGIKGVEEHAMFMKELGDSKRIRDRLQDVFETASIPGKSEKEIQRLLHFCVVGAGPSKILVVLISNACICRYIHMHIYIYTYMHVHMDIYKYIYICSVFIYNTFNDV
jgi:NADH:ubiquinone reductase (non-electrogenic)